MQASAIIPAYNEAMTIGQVIEILHQCPRVAEIIVVSDGSTDGTELVAARAGAQVVVLDTNQGKGAAMLAGVERSSQPVILFLDADLLGLTASHVQDLLYPVLVGEVQMTVGIFGSGRIATDLAQKVAPHLSGQRALRRELVYRLSRLELSRFGVETALSRYAKDQRWSVREVILNDVSHVMKEEKFGLVRGLSARFQMYYEISRSWLQVTKLGDPSLFKAEPLANSSPPNEQAPEERERGAIAAGERQVVDLGHRR